MNRMNSVAFVLGVGLTLVLLQVPAMATFYSDAVLADNPAMYWSFDGLTGGGNVPDLATGLTANELARTNAPLATHSSLGSGLYLGSASNLTASQATNFAADLSPTAALSNAYAVEFWAKFNDNSLAYVANFGSGSPYPGDQPGILRSWTGASGTAAIDIEGTGKTLGSPAVTDGAWHHYALVVYGASDNSWGVSPHTKIMRDGGTPVDITNTFTGILNWHGPAAIGAAFGPGVGPGGETYNLIGYLDEVAIYDLGGKTAAQIDTFVSTDLAGHYDAAAVPEPSAIVLLACGLAGLLAYAWRKRKCGG